MRIQEMIRWEFALLCNPALEETCPMVYNNKKGAGGCVMRRKIATEPTVGLAMSGQHAAYIKRESSRGK